MLNRRTLLVASLGAPTVFAPAVFSPARAQEQWPNRPIRIAVPFGPGGLADITTRVVGEKLGERLGQSVIVMNQPGAGGALSARVALGASDGHTLALLTNGTAVSAAFLTNMGFDPLRDFLPISTLGYFDFIVATSAEQPYRTLGDVVAAARAAPGKLNVGTVVRGSTQNLSAELLKSLTKIDFTIIPMPTTPEVNTALLRKDIDFAIDGYSALGPLVKDGKLRALATSGQTRNPLLPDVPTVIEQGVPGYDVTSWNALFAPKGTPEAVIARLNTEILRVLDDAGLKARLAALGIEAKGSTPADIGAKLKSDIARWNRLIDEVGVERQ